MLGLVSLPKPSIPRGTSLKKSKKRRARTSVALKSDNPIALAACRVVGGSPGTDLIAPFGDLGLPRLILGSLGVVWVLFWGVLGTLWGTFGALRAPSELFWGVLGTLWGTFGALRAPSEVGLGTWAWSG